MKSASLIFAFAVIIGTTARSFAADPPLGLYIQNGTLTHAGKPYYGVGLNYFSLFSRLIENPSDDTSLKQLKQLQAANIPFVRFMACGFWPRDWHLYQTDPDEYFRRFDKVVRAVEEAHIGLIPSLFWHYPTIPDLVGEPIDQLGEPNSKTTAFIKHYTEQIVTRYKDSPAIWAWEFGNEYSLAADLPNAATQRPQIVPDLGTPKTRTARDELTSAAAIHAYTVFTKEVRRHDSSRIMITGNALPRTTAWHNSAEKSWKSDTTAQFKEILLRDNPDPIDTLSVHLYPPDDNKFPAGTKDMPQLIHQLATFSKETHKPLFVGEFGVIQKGEDHAAQKKSVEEMLKAIEVEQIPLSALWVFDLKSQDDTLNVTLDNPRKDLLELIAQTNQRISQ